MSGIITTIELTSEFLLGISEYFNAKKLPTITCARIVWVDEVHMEQHSGPLSGTGYQIRLRRDLHGKLYNVAGLYYATKKNYKYTGQTCFYFGVVTVKYQDETTTGKRYNIFDYTEKNIIKIH